MTEEEGVLPGDGASSRPSAHQRLHALAVRRFLGRFAERGENDEFPS